MKFKEGESVVCLRSDGIPEFCVVVSSFHYPMFYMVRTENGSGQLMKFAEDDMFKNYADGLRMVINRIRMKIHYLETEIDQISKKIKEAKNDLQA